MTDRDATTDAARRWVEGYLVAWRSNEPGDITALFTPDGRYFTEPWLDPTVGPAAITEQWLERRDEPDAFEFEWDIAGVDGSRAFVQAVTRYTKGPVYSNLWVIDLADDGRARSFTEWWMDQADKS